MLWSKDWTARDRKMIEAGLVAFGKRLGEHEKRWVSVVDADLVIRKVLNETDFQSVLVAGYLLSFSLGTPWYAPSGVFVFEERLLLKVDPAATNLRPVIRAMERIARAEGCVGIAVGTALNALDERLAAVYRRCGFRTEAHTMYKELQ